MSRANVGSDGLVVLVTGCAGSGKSTLANRLAAELGAAIVAFDWLMSALREDTDVWATVEASGDRPREMGYRLLSRAVEQQLRIGGRCVVDVVARDSFVAELDELAHRYAGRLVVIERACSDPDLHRRRVAGRERAIPGWYELDADDAARSRERYVPVSAPKLELDAVDDLDENVRLAVRYARGEA